MQVSLHALDFQPSGEDYSGGGGGGHGVRWLDIYVLITGSIPLLVDY